MSKATCVVIVLSIALLLAFVASDDVSFGVGKAQCFERDLAENRPCATACTCNAQVINDTHRTNRCYLQFTLPTRFCPDSDENQLVIYWGDGFVYRETSPLRRPNFTFDVSHHYSSNGEKRVRFEVMSLVGSSSCRTVYTKYVTIRRC
ncbi:uncharacterized protein LOC134190089 [Corticium candelabrum]|uniref:uncharacterized protein LOC134190089 n=1 Tax=Corticium candelabrum TaxID=121492 RepID=UPI002E27075A|nr:uncharacterized protein LOC134190089 [Corticium candelabrum]